MRGEEGDGWPELAGVAAGPDDGGVHADRGLICCVWPTARGRASSSSTPVGRPGARAPARAAGGGKKTTRRRPQFGRLVVGRPLLASAAASEGVCRRRDRLEVLGEEEDLGARRLGRGCDGGLRSAWTCR
jgi:hypothetical protein